MQPLFSKHNENLMVLTPKQEPGKERIRTKSEGSLLYYTSGKGGLPFQGRDPGDSLYAMHFILFCLAALLGCRSNTDKIVQAPKEPLTHANFGLLGVRFYESSRNSKRWEIQSDFAELHRSENYLFLKSVTASFYAERTGNTIRTTSDHGSSFLDKNEVTLEGHVKIVSRSGYEFLLNKLHYFGDKHEFRSTDEVLMQGPEVKRPTMVLRGRGLVADIDQEHFFLKNKVTAKKRIKPDEWMHIRSSEGEFFTEEQRAIFIGNVQSHVPPGLAIRSKSMELVSVSGRELMEASGSVKLAFKDKVGQAEKAFFEAGGDRVILEGNAKIESKQNEVVGRRIVLYTIDDRVEVTQAQGKVRN